MARLCHDGLAQSHLQEVLGEETEMISALFIFVSSFCFLFNATANAEQLRKPPLSTRLSRAEAQELFDFAANIDHRERGIFGAKDLRFLVNPILLFFGNDDLGVVPMVAQFRIMFPNSYVIFSGGVGRLTEPLRKKAATEFKVNPEFVANMSEAEILSKLVQFKYGIRDNFFLEKLASNTGENARFAIELLKRFNLLTPRLSFVLLQTPLQQRRAVVTFKHELKKAGYNNPIVSITAYRPTAATMTDQELTEGLKLAKMEVEKYDSHFSAGFITKVKIPSRIKYLASEKTFRENQ